MINRILVCVALLFAFVGSASAAHFTACGVDAVYKHDHWAQCAQEREEADATYMLTQNPAKKPPAAVCVVIHQTGVVRDLAPDDPQVKMGMPVDCELTDINALNWYLAHGGH